MADTSGMTPRQVAALDQFAAQYRDHMRELRAGLVSFDEELERASASISRVIEAAFGSEHPPLRDLCGFTDAVVEIIVETVRRPGYPGGTPTSKDPDAHDVAGEVPAAPVRPTDGAVDDA